jgi:hypothetical protein
MTKGIVPVSTSHIHFSFAKAFRGISVHLFCPEESVSVFIGNSIQWFIQFCLSSSALFRVDYFHIGNMVESSAVFN